MSPTPRPLTALETFHARTVYLRLTLFKGLVVLSGTLFVILSLVLPVAFVMDDIRAPLPLILFLIVLDVLLAALGVLFVAHGLGRATTLCTTTEVLHGRLIEKKHTGSAGNGGGRYTVYTYFIDNIQIHWPPGAESLYKPLVGQRITLTVAMIAMRSRAHLQALLEGIGIRALKKKPTGLGVVLECPQRIDVHSALERYGRYFLLRYQLKMAAVLSLFVAIFLLPSFHPDATDWLVGQSHFLMIAIILGWIVGCGVVTFFVARGYQALRKWLNPDYDDTSHEEKLKGASITAPDPYLRQSEEPLESTKPPAKRS